MERYRIYDIDTQGNIYGVSGTVVKSFKTTKQAKNWIDKEIKLSEKKINSNGLKAWYTGDGNWTIAEDDGSWAIGSVKIKTTRERVEDNFGIKKFKVKVNSGVSASVRVTTQNTVLLTEKYRINKSQIATIKECMKLFNVFRSDARIQLEQTAHQQQKHEFEIMDCYDDKIEKHLLNLWILINN